jgi:hypothetical protein
VQHLAPYYPLRIQLVFERITSWKWQFSEWRKAHFVAKRPIQPNGRNTYISQRHPSVLDAGASTVLITCLYWVSFWRQCFQPLRYFKMEIASLCSNYAFSALLKKQSNSANKRIYVIVCNIWNLLRCENWGSFWKKYFLQARCFKVGKGSFCSK